MIEGEREWQQYEFHLAEKIKVQHLNINYNGNKMISSHPFAPLHTSFKMLLLNCPVQTAVASYGLWCYRFWRFSGNMLTCLCCGDFLASITPIYQNLHRFYGYSRGKTIIFVLEFRPWPCLPLMSHLRMRTGTCACPARMCKHGRSTLQVESPEGPM